MIAVEQFDRFRWFQRLTVGDARVGEPVITVEPTGDGLVLIDVTSGRDAIQFDVTPTDLDAVIQGLATARDLLRADQARRDTHRTQVQDLATQPRTRLTADAS